MVINPNVHQSTQDFIAGAEMRMFKLLSMVDTYFVPVGIDHLDTFYHKAGCKARKVHLPVELP